MLHQPLCFRLDPVAQAVHPLVQVQQLADDGADDHGENGDQRVAALEAAADADENDAQGHALHNDGLEPLSHGGTSSGEKTGKTPGQLCQKQACYGAGQHSQSIDDGTCQHIDSLSFCMRSRTTALPSSSPAVAGTQGLLAGTLRRPGGGASN